MINKTKQPRLAVIMITALSITACSGGDSNSGGEQLITELVRCAPVTGTVVQNNCSFNVNIRYFSSELSGPAPQETITLLSPGQTFDVSPFDSQQMSGVPACQAPLRPSQIFQATRIDCI